MRRRVAEAVVIDDLGDLDFGGAVDGLGELVVVDEHELGARRVDDVRLGEHAEQAAVLVDDVTDQGRVLDDAAAGHGELLLRLEGEGVALHEAAHERGGAHGPGGRGAVGVGVGDGDLGGLGALEDLGAHAVAAGDDDDAHAHLDGAQVDVRAVADDDDALVGRDAFDGRGLAERVEFHGGDAHVEFLDARGVVGDDLGAADGADDGVDRAGDLAHRGRALGLRDEVVAEAEDGDVAFEAAVLADDREGAHVMQVEELERAGARVVDADLERVAVHDVLDARDDVADEFREGGAEAAEDRVDARVGVAAAGGLEAGLAGGVLEGGVGEGGADGVSVRVLVADDIGRLGGTGQRKGRGDGHGGRRGKRRAFVRVGRWGGKINGPKPEMT